MNSEELRDLTESYYHGVYSEENIDEARRADKEFQLNADEKAAARNTSSAYYKYSPKDPKSPNRIRVGSGSIAQSLHAADTAKRLKKHKENRGKRKEMATGNRTGSELQNESQDLYDVVLEHLLSEGYADDARSAAVIMTHMSDEWLSNILGESKSDDRCDQELKDMGVPESWRNGVKRTSRRARNHQPKPTERQQKLQDKLSKYKG